jgi:hypothetical protein
MRYGILSEFTSYLVQEPVVTVNRQDFRRQNFRDLAPQSAPAPAQASGQGAVRAAAESQQMRAAKNTADLDALTKLEEGPADANARRVGGRMFVQRNGAWVDTQTSDTLRLVTIEPFSDAYFRLLRALPELKPYVQALDHVVIAGRSARIEIAAGGAQRLGGSEMDRLVREFRSR